ncbi:hypothetical protein RJ639_029282 [Escallonia herrerae]|uniref:GDSL esterase/lipase n=1 Tax=Escallonia herrerae TaxID=1293975 RepID=A0AA88XKT6_9ASTE|nr:hypothetical protein RJ639_029282 [Escallonia herrerae]
MERLLLLISLLLHVLLVSSAVSHNVPALYIFGDSIFDAGNNHCNQNCSAQADFPPYGSTGHYNIAAQFLGIPLQKPFLEAQIEIAKGSWKNYPSNGLNFASAGSGVLRGTNQDLEVIPLQEQLQQFKTLVDQSRIDIKLAQQSLFFLESGSNDIFNYFLPFDTPKLSPDAYVQAMLVEAGLFVDQIYKLGARHIAIFSLGPVGCVPARTLLPDASVDRCFGKMNRMVKSFNEGLESLALDILKMYPGAIGVYGSVYNVVQLFRAMPKR